MNKIGAFLSVLVLPGRVEVHLGVPRLIELPVTSLPSPLDLQLPEQMAYLCFVLGSSIELIACPEDAPPMFVECHDFKYFSNKG